MRDMSYSFRPHLARKWRGRGTGESFAKIAMREGGSEASRGGDGEGGGGKGRGLWVGACIDGGGGWRWAVEKAAVDRAADWAVKV